MQKTIVVEMRPLKDIKPYPRNARLNKETVKSLVQIIKRVGFNVPILIDGEGVIVKGHARYQAAKQLGIEELPCIVSENTEEENNQDRYLDNKISELARWDNEKLMYEIESVETDLREMGLEFRELRSEIREVSKADIDRAEDAQKVRREEKDMQGFLTVKCPKCDGEFEYEVRTY